MRTRASDLLLLRKPRILVITLRRLGDALLTTPLVRTLRHGFPDARLEILLFAGSERILKGNPDIDDVITMRPRATLGESLALLRRVWRRYDLVVSTQGGDRPTFWAWIAGRRRVGLIPAQGDGGWWKRLVLDHAVLAEPEQHRVTELLRLSDCLGLERQLSQIPPQAEPSTVVVPPRPYAVIHINPLYRYKRWTDAGWRGAARALSERGLAVVATEGRDPEDRAYADAVWGAADPPVIRERGQLDFGALAALLKDAAVYIGPDTSITHLAAACGCPTVALYGATSPRLIGPWPVGGVAEPWQPAGTIQHRGNVWVVQNPLPCLPCEKLGCDGHLDSRAQCLDELGVAQVMRAVDMALMRSDAAAVSAEAPR
jgi:lipopolysaccharide heptosyltransferase III